jgi:cytidylate kinase-like protein
VSVVTVAGPAGSWTAEVARGVGRELGLPVLDAVIPAAVARRLGASMWRAVAHDDRVGSLIERLFGAGGFFCAEALLAGVAVPLSPDFVIRAEAFHRETEALIRGVRDGVIVGRAAAVVLGPRADVFHVRLAEDDPERAAYCRRRYGVELASARLYDLVLDPSDRDVEACARTIACAAGRHFQGLPAFS